MMDLYLKKIVIHQFTPDDTELILSDKCLTINTQFRYLFSKKSR